MLRRFSHIQLFVIPGSSVPEILQARILEWVARPSSRGSSWSKDWTSCLWHWQAGSLLLAPPGYWNLIPHWMIFGDGAFERWLGQKELLEIRSQRAYSPVLFLCKGLEHLQIFMSKEAPGTNPLWLTKDAHSGLCEKDPRELPRTFHHMREDTVRRQWIWSRKLALTRHWICQHLPSRFLHMTGILFEDTSCPVIVSLKISCFMTVSLFICSYLIFPTTLKIPWQWKFCLISL